MQHHSQELMFSGLVIRTKFDSKLIGIEQVKFEVKRRGLKDVKVDAVAVLLDREQGASNIAKQHDITLHSLIPFKSKGINWLESKMSSIELNIIKDYLENPEKYQHSEIQKFRKNCTKRL